MPNKAPANWEEKTLGDILDKGSSNLSANKLNNCDGIYPVYGAGGLVKKINFYQQEQEYLAIIKDGAGVGRVYHYEPKTSILGTLQYLFPKKNVNIRFAYYYLQSIDFKKYYQGAAIPHIYYKDYKFEQLILPPLSEQERIVRILDEAFENIEKAKQNTLQNLNNAKELFESHLKTFFEKNNSDWREYRLIDITSKIGSGSTPLGGKKSYTNEGISLIRSMNVHDRQFVYEGLAHINEQQANELNGVTICENDVLLNITGASVARCCVVPNDVIPARVNQHVSIIRPRLEYVSAKFLCYLLTSKYYKDRLLKEGEEGGATRQALTKSGLEQFVISIPEDLDMQEKVVGQLEKIHEYTQKLEQTYNKKLQSLDELKQSILQKAFNGEL